jgi:NtrC-family two-component system sensor histidine kinase KinB
MLLKTKLSLGLGFLFLIILTLAACCAYYVGQSSREAENILKNNYDSIVYARDMLAALDEISAMAGGASEYQRHRYDQGVAAFDQNLKKENGNITEVQEQELVGQLNGEYAVLAKLGRQLPGAGRDGKAAGDFLAASGKVKQLVNGIFDLNLQAVVRKSQLAKRDSMRFQRWMAMIGTFCFLLALVYFWYFPFYISNTYNYLSQRLWKLLPKFGIHAEVKTNDEAFQILHAIDLLENSPAAKQGEAVVKKP